MFYIVEKDSHLKMLQVLFGRGGLTVSSLKLLCSDSCLNLVRQIPSIIIKYLMFQPLTSEAILKGAEKSGVILP